MRSSLVVYRSFKQGIYQKTQFRSSTSMPDIIKSIVQNEARPGVWMKNIGRSLAISVNKGILWGGGLALGLWVMISAFKDSLKADTVIETTDLTTRVIANETVRDSALLLSREVVGEVLTDPELLKTLEGFLYKLSVHGEIETTLANLLRPQFTTDANMPHTKGLVISILSNPESTKAVSRLTRDLVDRIQEDPELLSRTSTYLSEAYSLSITNDKVQKSAGDALINILYLMAGLRSPPDETQANIQNLQDKQQRILEVLSEAEQELAVLQAKVASLA
eukprot:TRINITY_DN3372_c0_g1_i1.p1 TRINITY_DN3372_c0_g1~~TRINITY_DN3372_c0_g1_i1.p1  ORF type:complete len:278 (+),score=44.31 TRINITY_DN3372_c0_g1_i1:301-1134(+)